MPRISGVAGTSTVSAWKLASQSDVGQLVGLAQPKDLIDVIIRSGVSAADVGAAPYDPTSLATIDTRDAAGLWIGGDCSAAPSSIQFALVLWTQNGDQSFRLMGISPTYQLTSGLAYGVGGRYLAYGTPVYVDLMAAAKVAIMVTSVSTGSWNLYAKPY